MGPLQHLGQLNGPTRPVTHHPHVKFVEKKGHIAIKFWNQFNHSYQLEDIPQALDAMTLEDFSHNDEWTADTGASSHMTGDPGIQENLRRYFGNDIVIIGDGSSHAITYIGYTYLDNGTTKIK